jgi:hypothetical protein
MSCKPTDEMEVQEAMAYYNLAVERADVGDLHGAVRAGDVRCRGDAAPVAP